AFIGGGRPPNHCFAALSSWIRTTRSHQMFGVYLRTLGHFDEAEAEMRRAVELDPLTRHFSYQLGRVLACAGRPADAAMQFAKQLALDSIYPPAHYELAKALASQGD